MSEGFGILPQPSPIRSAIRWPPRRLAQPSSARLSASEPPPAGRTTRFEYDGAGRLKAVIDNLNQRTEYGNDAHGNRITQKDARGNVTKFGFDQMNRQASRELPLGMRETMRYDDQGRLVEKVDFKGVATTYVYDINDRLKQTNHGDGRTTLFDYDANGQRTRSEQRFTNGAIEITTYQYDERGRLKEVVYTDGSFVRYAYDAAGNRTELTTPSATVNYTFDTLNRLSTVIAPEGTTTYGYDAVGNRASETKPNGVVTSYRYNPRNQLTWMAHKAAAGALLLGLSYTLDASGMRMKIEEFGGASEATASLQTTRAYVYDPLMRLTEEAVTCGAGYALCAPRTTNWTYDQVGNRQTQVHQHGGGVATTTYRYDANDRLLDYALSGQPKPEEFVGVTTNRYDANGSLSETIEPATASTTKKTVYGWDSENHLIAASITQTVENVQSTKEIRYTYNADGIRRTQTVGFGEPGAETMLYLVDPNQSHAQVIEESRRLAIEAGAGQFTVRYSFGRDLISQNRAGSGGGAIGYYHLDGMGSTRILSDSAGGVSDEIRYAAFGQTDANGTRSRTNNHYLYAGERFDQAAGLYYLRARYMSPTIGRLLSADEFPGVKDSPITMNGYLYANSNPSNLTDPSGYFAFPIGYAMASALAGIIIFQELTGIGSSKALMPKMKPWYTSPLKKPEVRLLAGEEMSVDARLRWRGFPLIVFGNDVGEAARHYQDALTERPWNALLARQRPPHPRPNWRTFPGTNCTGVSGGGSGLECDEFPFASSIQGGVHNLQNLSLRPLNRDDNGAAGRKLNNLLFMGCGVENHGMEFGVLSTPNYPTTMAICSDGKMLQ